MQVSAGARSVAGRVIAAWIAAAIGGLAGKLGIEITPEHQVAIFNLSMGITLTVYGLVHKAINSKLNPADAAAPRMIPPVQ